MNSQVSKTDYNKIIDAIKIIRKRKGTGLILMYLEQWPVEKAIVEQGLKLMDKHNLNFLVLDKKGMKKQ